MNNKDRKRLMDTIREMMGKTYTGKAKTAQGIATWKVHVNENVEFVIDTECNGVHQHKKIGRKNRREWIQIARDLAKGSSGDIQWKEVTAECEAVSTPAEAEA